ncbi:MAG: hypothetical protein EOO65_05845, partial [Methanosarcinales archaeon]
MDALPALMNSIKMVHTIARYFNTPERMTDMFVKITYAIIANCARFVTDLDRDTTDDNLWRKDPARLVPRLELCLKVNELYQESYRLTKEKLCLQPLGKQFDFDEAAIFGRIDSFCRRIIKLIDLYTTVQQFRALEAHQVDGLAPLIRRFDVLVSMLQARKHNLMNFMQSDFDRAYVEFNVSVDALELQLQTFVSTAFEAVKSVDASLQLLAKFETVLRRQSLATELS